MVNVARITHPMIPPGPLQVLHDLDRTSPQFHKQLSDLLRGDEYRNVVPDLQDDDTAWLVEYLDNVSLQPSFPTPPTASVQVLTGIPNRTSLEFTEFLQELGNICGVKGVLPQSCVLANPPASEATPDDKRLRIKHVRSHADGHSQKVKWPHFQCHFPLLLDTQETIDLSPGGCSVETLDAPKHRPHTRRYPQSPPAHL